MSVDLDDFSTQKFYSELTAHKISMAFQGIFSQDILTLLGHSLRGTPNDKIVAKRLFAIVVELAQNIHHYSAQKQFSEKDQKEIGTGIVAIAEDAETYTISSGNLIQTPNLGAIVERANHINRLSSDELRDYYREQRKAPQRVGKPGANLGLIDMVRKSGNPVKVVSEGVDDQYSFLILSVKISKKQ